MASLDCNGDLLAKRFDWASVLLTCSQQLMPDSYISTSLFLKGQGSDSDFSGGAAGWEVASHFLEAAARKKGWEINLAPLSTCESCLHK